MSHRLHLTTASRLGPRQRRAQTTRPRRIRTPREVSRSPSCRATVALTRTLVSKEAPSFSNAARAPTTPLSVALSPSLPPPPVAPARPPPQLYTPYPAVPPSPAQYPQQYPQTYSQHVSRSPSQYQPTLPGPPYSTAGEMAANAQFIASHPASPSPSSPPEWQNVTQAGGWSPPSSSRASRASQNGARSGELTLGLHDPQLHSARRSRRLRVHSFPHRDRLRRSTQARRAGSGAPLPPPSRARLTSRATRRRRRRPTLPLSLRRRSRARTRRTCPEVCRSGPRLAKLSRLSRAILLSLPRARSPKLPPRRRRFPTTPLRRPRRRRRGPFPERSSCVARARLLPSHAPPLSSTPLRHLPNSRVRRHRRTQLRSRAPTRRLSTPRLRRRRGRPSPERSSPAAQRLTRRSPRILRSPSRRSPPQQRIALPRRQFKRRLPHQGRRRSPRRSRRRTSRTRRPVPSSRRRRSTRRMDHRSRELRSAIRRRLRRLRPPRRGTTRRTRPAGRATRHPHRRTRLLLTRLRRAHGLCLSLSRTAHLAAQRRPTAALMRPSLSLRGRSLLPLLSHTRRRLLRPLSTHLPTSPRRAHRTQAGRARAMPRRQPSRPGRARRPPRATTRRQ